VATGWRVSRRWVRRSALGDATVLESQPGRRWLPGAALHRGPLYAGDVPCPRAGPMPVVRSAATTSMPALMPGCCGSRWPTTLASGLTCRRRAVPAATGRGGYRARPAGARVILMPTPHQAAKGADAVCASHLPLQKRSHSEPARPRQGAEGRVGTEHRYDIIEKRLWRACASGGRARC
jgi:hypothetical protein